MDSTYYDNIKPLDKYMSPLDVWGMALGCMVGWGVFAMPGNTFLPVAGPAGTIISLLIGMVIMLVIGYNFSYLMGRSAITGGVYSYTKEAFGRDHAFLSSWFLCLSYLTIVFLNGTALFFIVRILFDDAVQNSPSYVVAGNSIFVGETLISVVVLAVVGLLFVVAKPFLQKLQTVLAIILFVGITITFFVTLPSALSQNAFRSFGILGLNRTYAVFSLMIMAPWAFVGFEVTAFDTAHFNFPVKHSKWVLFTSIIAAAFAYIAMVSVSIASVPDGFGSWQEYIAGLSQLSGIESLPTFNAARAIMGTPGLVIMTVTAIAAIMTGIIGGYRAATRVLSTMAEDKILSEQFSKTTYSIVFIMGLAILLSLLGRNTLNWFVDLTSFGAIVGFGYVSAAAYKIAKTEGNRSCMITGIVGAVISTVFGIVQLVPRLAAMEAMGSEAFLLLSLWCLIGFVFYWRTVVRGSLTEYSGMSLSGVVLFALLVYSAIMWLAKRIIAYDDMDQVRRAVAYGGVLMLAVIFIGLAVMIYVQNVVRKKHEQGERVKIHAVESSLAKSQFLFNMSHDIRTPMNAIIGYTEIAKNEQDVDKLHEYLDKINGSSQHLLDLINDVLEMSRIESGKLKLEFVPVDLKQVFDGMYDLFSMQMKEKNIDFKVHTNQIVHRYVWGDKKNLNRILLNIISNAYKFTPEGGTITASVWENGNVIEGYGSYEIRVSDTGIGMSKEFADKMFTAFERERSSTVSGVEGTGLGLSITKSIVDLMGGTIDVLTAPGSGTKIVIRLKLKIDENGGAAESENKGETVEKAAEAEKAEERTIDFSGKRLLLVEDNMVNMEIAKMILTQAGFEVDTAENGQLAVDIISGSEPGYYNAILMDIQMPVMDGYEATRTIRRLENKDLAEIPIMAMTANAFSEDVEAAKNAGMQAHIAKPIDIAVLMKTLTDVLIADEKKKEDKR